MKKKIMIFSGFLGSGKTTTMVNTAKYLKEKGVKIAVITNDLGSNLVDTNYANMEYLPVSEIPDGCFCHDVDTFTKKINQLYDEVNPDVIFAEPVGSCVDIVKNVYYEIAAKHKDLELAPFTAVIDPMRYKTIYMGIGNNTFQPQITYMYKKQLEEADILLLNKIDILSDEEQKEILDSVKAEFPDKVVVPISAFESRNLDLWTDEFLEGQTSKMNDLEIDWDYVVQAENMMGWYNKHFSLSKGSPLDFNKLAITLLEALRDEFKEMNIEIAHMKLMLSDEDEYCKTALTGISHSVFLSNKFPCDKSEVNAILNIRAQTTPDVLETLVEKVLQRIITDADLSIRHQKTQVFDSFDHAPEPTIIL